MATELGVAYISVVGETSKLRKDIRDALNGVDNAKVNVDADTGGARGDLERFRATQEKNPLNIDVDVDTRGASAHLKGLRRDLEGLARSDIGKINLGAIGIASLPALAAGLAEVASALQQVAQAGLALPGVLAGAGSSIGTLALGLTGIKDAYTAVTAATDDAATSSGDSAAQARSAASASNSLRNAVVDETQARQDVARATRDARNELADLNIEMRGGLISEKRAVLEAQKAREDLASGKFTDIRDQLLRIEEADQRVVESHARNTETAEELADANAKGVEGSDQVVAANERLTRSQQQVADAQSAVASSGPKASAAQEKSALAMSKLAPNAQEFVKAFIALQNGPLGDLRKLVQDNIFDGLGDQLTVVTEKALPTFEKGLGSISDSWNDTFHEMGAVLSKDESLSLMDRIFGNTAEAQKRLNKVIDPLVDGLGTLAAAGSDSLPRMADGLAGVTERFANFIKKADEDGSLDKWIDEGITAMGQLGETALNVGKMFTAITKAAGVSDLLGDIESLTDGWQKFLNSAEGQQVLQDIFRKGKEEFEKWRPILEDLPGLFEGVFKAADLYTGLLVQVLDPITTLLSDHPALVETAAAAYLAFSSARTLGAIATLSNSLLGLGGVIGKGSGTSATGLIGGVYVFAALLGVQLGETIFDQMTKKARGAEQAMKDANAQLHDQFPGTPLNPTDVASGTTGSTGPTNPLNPNNIYGDGTTNPSGGSNTAGQLLGPSMSGSQGFPSTTAGTYGLPSGTDTGGYGTGSSKTFPPWVMQIADAFGVKPSTYAGHQDTNRQESGYAPNPQHLNRGIDWSGPPDKMQAFADYLKTVPGMEQVIWNGAGVGTGDTVEIAGGKPQPGYFAGDLAAHGNHVHTRQSMPIPPPPWLRAAPGFLAGGPVKGAGGPTEDQILAWLSDGEHVWTADEVAAVGGQGQMQQLRSMAQAGQLTPQMLSGTVPGGLTANGRTEGYIPAGAGYSGKTGGGVAGSLIGLGGEFAKGAIQAAADTGKMAAAVGSFGAGGQAAGAGIQAGADAAKRGVDYGVEMAGIGVGALSEILLPFGAPRWLSDVDPTSFMPHSGVQGAATTTAEQAVLDQQNQQGSGVDPNTMQHGTAMDPMNAPGVGNAPPPAVEPAGDVRGGDTINLYPKDVDESFRLLNQRQKLQAMQYGGRP